MRSLVARDVIVGEDKYQFTIELQRLWIQKYAKLDWVKEEITPTVQRWQLPPEKIVERQQLRRNKTDLAALAIILGVFAALIILLFQGMRSLNDSVVSERAQRQTSEAQLDQPGRRASHGHICRRGAGRHSHGRRGAALRAAIDHHRRWRRNARCPPRPPMICSIA